MSADSPPGKWHRIDSNAAKLLSGASLNAGEVVPIGTTALPSQLQAIQHVASAFVSQYPATVSLTPSFSVARELLVVRADGPRGKCDVYPLGTSSDARVFFSGPFKDAPAHHFELSKPPGLPVMFGSPRFSNRSAP